MGFPAAGEGIPVTVDIALRDGEETWTRSFGGRSFSSVLRAGRGPNSYLLLERFGMIEVALALVAEAGRLSLVARKWWFLGLPLPRALLPHGICLEDAPAGRFRFDIEICLPLLGLIVAYRGELVRADHP